MSEIPPPAPEEASAYWADGDVKLAWILIRNYVESALDARHAIVRRSHDDVAARFREGRLSDPDKWFFLDFIGHVMMFMSDLGAVIHATRRVAVGAMGKRWYEVRSVEVRHAMRSLLSPNASEVVARLVGFPSVKAVKNLAGDMSVEEVKVFVAVRDLCSVGLLPDLRMVARLFLHHETVLHKLKHNPATLVTLLDEAAPIAWSLVKHLGVDTEGATVPIPISPEVFQAWGQAAEATTAILQLALHNYEMKARLVENAFPPVTLFQIADRSLVERYLAFGNRLAVNAHLGEITLQIQAQGEVTPGAWLDDGDPVPLPDRLRWEAFPLDAVYLGQPPAAGP